MKTLLFLLLSALAVHGQNYSVRLWRTMPTNAAERLAGMPDDAPVPHLSVAIGSGTVVQAPAVLMTRAQLLECTRTNAGAIAAAESNLLWQAEAPKRNALSVFRNLFDDFQAYHQFTAVSNPTPAQVAAHIRKLNGAMLSLGPILRELYESRQ